LNWDGRGKNKASCSRSGFGHITFAPGVVDEAGDVETAEMGLGQGLETQRDLTLNAISEQRDERKEMMDPVTAHPASFDPMSLNDGLPRSAQFTQSYQHPDPPSRNFEPNSSLAVAQHDAGSTPGSVSVTGYQAIQQSSVQRECTSTPFMLLLLPQRRCQGPLSHIW
jgi:hypothetical protein